MMRSTFSRRNLIKAMGAATLAPVLPQLAAAGQDAPKPWWLGNGMPQESVTTPKIACAIDVRNGVADEAIRNVVQIGVCHVLSNGPAIPWAANQLQPIVDKLKAGGVRLGNLMITGFPNVVYGRPGRDDEIDKIRQSIQAAGHVGLPVVEYNFYAHRAMEGYFEETGRGGAGLTGVDYERMKDLPPLPQEGAHALDEMWANISYFLKAVIPVAEKANVRLALHPNDPPFPRSRGSQQIMATVAGWKHLIEIVDSPANGITFDCGVTMEMGEDPVEVCRYFGSRDRINHMHYRNPHVTVPYLKYDEGFIDEGDVNMFAVMRELIKLKYSREVYPEHPRAIDYDRERGSIRGYPGGGGYAGDLYDIAYAKAMLQAALIVERTR
ncbi:D-mannonate dehydratase [Candidatus Sulfotelmatomonas gaucii]|uniref:mannonate dehydratase n=1 Tax=Candidatus Sulfuritelmatomonas gaucii TaxID=2043161 RepID=A0A2N9L735_9BACT|nr:D-mannonate dehydratase [Candidatus Sulfotelmatomonas gaucii]